MNLHIHSYYNLIISIQTINKKGKKDQTHFKVYVQQESKNLIVNTEQFLSHHIGNQWAKLGMVVIHCLEISEVESLGRR